jgi:hypothetical protein
MRLFVEAGELRPTCYSRHRCRRTLDDRKHT